MIVDPLKYHDARKRAEEQARLGSHQPAQAAQVKKPRKPKLCHDFRDFKSQWGPLKLEQAGVDNFIVTYGLQVDRDLTYSEACAKLGQALMHCLACDGMVDNREPRR